MRPIHDGEILSAEQGDLGQVRLDGKRVPGVTHLERIGDRVTIQSHVLIDGQAVLNTDEDGARLQTQTVKADRVRWIEHVDWRYK